MGIARKGNSLWDRVISQSKLVEHVMSKKERATYISTHLMMSVTADYSRPQRKLYTRDQDTSSTHERGCRSRTRQLHVGNTQSTDYKRATCKGKQTSLTNISDTSEKYKRQRTLTYLFKLCKIYAHVNVKHIPSNEPRQKYGNSINLNNAAQ